MLLYAVLGLIGVLGVTTLSALFLRRVVSTNEVHIVQTAKHTKSYGKDSENGNTYYEWPAWIPFLGVTKSVLPTSVFDLDIKAYEAYDQGRLPFMVDVVSFFRISDSNIAAQRVSTFEQLLQQLQFIVQGSIRVILARSDIETILSNRATFGEQFTKEIEGQLLHWGVCAVKNLELMDIRDSQNSQVIQNIMAKKKSHIEMESRTEVAKNRKLAEIAEIESKREVDLQQQQAQQTVGLRMVETEKQVSISKQSALQLVREQEKLTKEKEMDVLKVQQVRTAQINKETAAVQAEQNKQVSILNAEGQKQTSILTAEGTLESKRREAEAITLQGAAKANAEKAMQLAPVEAQIVLAKEIGQNESYQKYLVTIKQVEAQQAIGVEQAKALDNAEVKIIANTGTNLSSGINNVMDLFSAKGGTQVGAMLEGLAQTDAGQALVNKVLPVSKKTNGTANL